jgi:hypothetical protein
LKNFELFGTTDELLKSLSKMSRKNNPLACKWCGQIKPLIKAHIVPRNFFELILGNSPEKYTVLVRTNTKKPRTFLQAGIYDTSILCADCDRRFSNLDEYGWEILGKPLKGQIITDPVSGVELAIEISGVDTDRLRRFILSVLWRSSVSSLDVYSNVSLGPKFQKEVQARIFDPKPLSYDEYSTCFVAIEEPFYKELSKAMFPPYRAKLDGLNWQILYFPGLKVLVKVDSRKPTDGTFTKLMVSHPDRFYFVKPMKGLSQELDYMMRMRAEFAKDTKQWI